MQESCTIPCAPSLCSSSASNDDDDDDDDDGWVEARSESLNVVSVLNSLRSSLEPLTIVM